MLLREKTIVDFISHKIKKRGELRHVQLPAVVEAAAIEPASRGTSALASTCVACQLRLAPLLLAVSRSTIFGSAKWQAGGGPTEVDKLHT